MNGPEHRASIAKRSLFAACAALILALTVFSLLFIGGRVGCFDEEHIHELSWYPRIVMEVKGTNPAGYRLMEPDVPPKQGLHFFKAAVRPAWSFVYNGDRIPILVLPYTSAVLFDFFMPFKKIFPGSVVWVRFFPMLLWAAVLLMLFTYERQLSGRRVAVLSGLLMVTNPFMFYINIPVGSLIEVGVGAFAFMTMEMFRVWQMTRKRAAGAAFILLFGLTLSIKLSAAIPLCAFFCFATIADRAAVKSLIRKSKAALVPAFLLLLPPLFFVLTENTKASGVFSGYLNFSILAAGFRNAFINFSYVFIRPEAFIAMGIGVKGANGFPLFYSLFSAASLAWALSCGVARISERFKGLAAGTPFLVGEILAVLLPVQFLAYAVLYRTTIDIQCFFPIMIMVYIAQAQFLLRLSRSAAAFFKRGDKTAAAVAAVILLAVVSSHTAAALRIEKMFDSNTNAFLDLGVQRRLVGYLQEKGVVEFFTTVETQVAMTEFLSGERLRPYHLYMTYRASDAEARKVFNLTLRNTALTHYLFEAHESLYSGLRNGKDTLEEIFLLSARDAGCDVTLEKVFSSRRGVALEKLYNVSGCYK